MQVFVAGAPHAAHEFVVLSIAANRRGIVCSIGIGTVSIGLAWKRRKKSRFISLTDDILVDKRWY